MPWYVMRAKPNKEELLFEQLHIRAIDAYYPHVRVKPVNPRARKTKPYFPGYLFIRAELNVIAVSALNWMPGGLGLVDFGKVPASVPDELLQTIRQKVEQVNINSEKRPLDFKTGEIVMIESGPFTGYKAIFDSALTGQERVRVLLQFLSDRQVGVELSVKQIKH